MGLLIAVLGFGFGGRSHAQDVPLSGRIGNLRWNAVRPLAAGCAVGLWAMISACRFRVVDSKLVTRDEACVTGLKRVTVGIAGGILFEGSVWGWQRWSAPVLRFASYHGFSYRRAYCPFSFPRSIANSGSMKLIQGKLCRDGNGLGSQVLGAPTEA